MSPAYIFSWNACTHNTDFCPSESADPLQIFKEDEELYIADFNLPVRGLLLLGTFCRPQRAQKKTTMREAQLAVCEETPV